MHTYTLSHITKFVKKRAIHVLWYLDQSLQELTIKETMIKKEISDFLMGKS